jgi:YegS/Rv2252/BmrU family lipid kinase
VTRGAPRAAGLGYHALVKPVVIVNPQSAAGRTGRHFDAIARAVRGAIGDFECAFTQAPRDGRRLAREALDTGTKLVVAVGGDGTASEVIDGLLDEGRAVERDAQFGYVPRGTGGDLRKTLCIGPDLASAARALAGRDVITCDLGRVAYLGHDGRAEVRHFANVAGFGVAGVVSAKVNGGLRLPSGKLSFMLAAARALVGWRDQPVRWRVDGGSWETDRITSLSVCNGRYFGGGMLVAPDAHMDDGLFDVVVWKGFGIKDFVVKRPMLYDGTHVRLPNTRVLRARTIEAEALEDARVLLDVDGEQPGTLPARFDLLPGALRVRVGPEAHLLARHAASIPP